MSTGISSGISSPTTSISKTVYYAATGISFGVAIVAATARVYIRIFRMKVIHADDYLFCLATLTLIAGTALSYTFVGDYFLFLAISEGRTPPPLNFTQKITEAATYALIAEVLCWTTIFSVKLSFLLYFRALVDRLYRVELWWWFNIVVFIPIAAINILGPFIVCPHTGPSVFGKPPTTLLAGLIADVQTVHCTSSPEFLRQEHNILYFSVTADIVTDIMLISIPIIVLRKATFDLGRKLSIAAVLCMSLLMIAIALVRGVSAAILGTEDQTWSTFWVQLETSVSIIAACPTAFRSLFLLNQSSRSTPDQRSVFERLLKRNKPSLPSIHAGATLTGMRTVIRGDIDTELASQDDGEYALLSAPSHNLHSHRHLESP